eukprot:1855557-Alexandrium_andersonii.AAC.1
MRGVSLIPLRSERRKRNSSAYLERGAQAAHQRETSATRPIADPDFHRNCSPNEQGCVGSSADR